MVRALTVLVVDDEPRMRRLIRIGLEDEGYRVLAAENGAVALALLESERPELVLLDVAMPGLDGFQTLERIRAVSSVPVILLTGRGGTRDKVRGLDLGADDYLTKPFNPEELLARIRALLRRSNSPLLTEPRGVLAMGELVIDLDQRKVLVAEREVALSPTEWQLLYYLAANAGRVIVHEDLLSMAWGPEYRNDLQYLRVWISRLRRKLSDDPARPRFIRTIPGVGYMVPPPEGLGAEDGYSPLLASDL